MWLYALIYSGCEIAAFPMNIVVQVLGFDQVLQVYCLDFHLKYTILLFYFANRIHFSVNILQCHQKAAGEKC